MQQQRYLLLPLAAALLASTVSLAAETTAERLLKASQEPNNWLTHHGSYDASRHSTLDQINKSNVGDLKVAWTFALGGIEGGGIWPHGGLEGTPIVEDGAMYVTDGWGSVYKLDISSGSGKLLWKMNPETDKDWAGAVACCGVNNRGVGLWKDKVVSHTLDGRLVVTNKETGEIEWERQLADPAIGETITGAPLIVKDMAITGVGGAEYGIRGWLAATDLNTQEESWRRFTIPGPGEPGHETWQDLHDAWKNGGGSTWVTGSYDPDQDLIIWGVGNPGPDWDAEYRPGDNLYTNSAIALDADSGTIKWHFQYTPNDPYDYDAVSEHILVDTEINGEPRKIALHADRNGFGYALDRTSGQFIWGTPFVKRLTWTRGLDPETGRPLDYDPEKKVQSYVAGTAPSRSNPVGVSCPGNMGGKNWPPTAYNPQHNMWYIPVIESCNTMTNQETIPGESYKPREFFTGGGPSQHEQISGSITAIDVATGKVVAKHETKYPMLGGMLSTAGDLVFTGQPAGEFVALDAKTLDELWRFETNAGINAPPMTFSIDGKQYIGLLVGLGGAWPKWFVDGTDGLEKMEPSSMLYVFAL
ncbi:MAG: PQQ-dependent dehydrogenase, methanol/ethanol family [Candidatus Competibacteraceae bacterium]|nr:PQQ-dependent dehydrogenase, methanol/ethanol family [Candidatus Competibacteraceae bacterium]MCB1804512.1 PQQ-dependent dehydrogenase, methanol/ethanol family [Candidatus Competibacteraceae bacterium]MCB1813993.1 PQQ-dependent dehydrogenase, methanol/ethanol family [Candidatus Competibacteraceae bacterium]